MNGSTSSSSLPCETLGLMPQEVQLWRIDTPLTKEELAHLTTTLSEAELKRASDMISQEQKNRFIARRGLLRQILAQYMKIDPASVVLTYGPQGKPMLCAEAHPGILLQFNLTHSRDVALLAIGLRMDIGVDIEAIDPSRNTQGIGERYFHDQEWQRIAALPQEKQAEAFFDNWACKEAVVKAQGGGVMSGLTDYVIQGSEDQPGVRHCLAPDFAAIQAAAAISKEPDKFEGFWRLFTLRLSDQSGQQFAAAVAMPGENWRIAESLYLAQVNFNSRQSETSE